MITYTKTQQFGNWRADLFRNIGSLFMLLNHRKYLRFCSLNSHCDMVL